MKKTVSKKEHDRVVGQLHEELRRQTGLIKQLKEENLILIKAALKQATKTSELSKKVTTQRK
ncbi:hypothetical protein GOV04_01470 [Candidatus Woesearchaeota archaeon]|nr:hypothetical protein [Candidatus Woesearchaeota archaeon]